MPSPSRIHPAVYLTSGGALPTARSLYLMRSGLNAAGSSRPSPPSMRLPWRAETRCTEWSVHDVVRHVRDATSLHVSSLGGRTAPFSAHGPFHPSTTPAVWLAASAGQSPEETLRELVVLSEEEDRLLERKAELNPSEARPGPLRRTLHWSVASAHFFWDAWLHERDIALCIGLKMSYPAAELRLATMYGLLVAATPADWSGEYVQTKASLGGSPDHGYEITHADDTVMVATVSPELSAELTGETGEILDSLAGRGPEPSELFGMSSTAVSRLTLLRQVAT